MKADRRYTPLLCLLYTKEKVAVLNIKTEKFLSEKGNAAENNPFDVNILFLSLRYSPRLWGSSAWLKCTWTHPAAELCCLSSWPQGWTPPAAQCAWVGPKRAALGHDEECHPMSAATDPSPNVNNMINISSTTSFKSKFNNCIFKKKSV